MALDQYQLCPCGSGKKIKFCCSKDIIVELDKISRALAGEQRVSALDQINRVIEDKGLRASLLALKADAQLSLDQVEDAVGTVAQFQKIAPYNPVALALAAILTARDRQAGAAVEKLQQALEYVDQQMPATVYAAIGVVASALIADGDVLGARGHWLMQAGLAGDRDRSPIDVLMRINASPEIPLLLKEDHFYAHCPDGVAWSGEFNAAMKSARRGAWLAACENLASLTEKVPNEPAIVKNSAILRGWLGQTDQAIAAWRKYASLEAVPDAEAVEAEALSQLLEATTHANEVDRLTIHYPVPDTARLMEHLVSDKRATQMPVDLQQLAAEDEPPPQGAFWLLDRPAVESNPEIELDEIPQVLGELLLFGKQTDRDARLEFSLTDSDASSKKAALDDLAGELTGEPTRQEKTGSVPGLAESVSWRWRLPHDVTPQRRSELLERQQRKMMLEVWPQTAQPLLDGKTPAQVADDPAYRVRLQAAIVLLELAGETKQVDFDFNLLRDQLGLPSRGPVQLDEPDAVMKISLCRLSLLDPTSLSDDELFKAYQRAVLKSHRTAILRLGPEVLKRDEVDERLSKYEVYRSLVAHCHDPDLALEYVEQGRQHTVSAGQSPASWLLTELSIRLSRLEGDHCNRLVQTLQSRHLEEPGIAESLYQLLVNHGLIDEEGRPLGEVPPEAALAGAAEQPAADAGKIWTPESPQPAPSGEQKSKLWVPGMD